MKYLSALLLLVVGLEVIGAGIDPASVTTAQSRSGQFAVSGWARGKIPSGLITGPNDNRVQMTPELMAVTCERVKEAFLILLDGSDHWQGKMYVFIRPNLPTGSGVTVSPVLSKGTFIYNVDVPERIEPERLVRGIVLALIEEAANRSARGRAAEIPLWLVEGLTRQLWAEKGSALVVEAPDSVFVRGNVWRVGVSKQEGVKDNPLLGARAYLQGKPILSFTELCLPTHAQLTGEGWLLFQNSAQVLCASLLQMPKGREQMREMITMLPQHLNWQTAFLIAYATQFQRLLDVEKWWAVTMASFTGRNEHQQLSRSACLAKLDEILLTPVNTDECGERADSFPTAFAAGHSGMGHHTAAPYLAGQSAKSHCAHDGSSG